MEHLINELFAAVLAVTPWAAVLILLLLGLRRVHKNKLSPRFFQLAFLILALRLALPFDLSISKAPVQAPLPAPVRQVIETPVLPQISLNELVENGATSLAPEPAPQQTEKAQPKIQLSRFLPLVWLAGAAVFLGFHLASYIAFQLRLHRSRQEADAEICRLAQKEFKRPVRVWISKEVPSPLLTGLLHPAVYLTQSGVQKQDLPYILAHEACHARRLDLPAQFLLLTAQSIHWFNPLVHMMARAARDDMERGCDEAVLAGQDLAYRKAYGGAVLASLAASRQQRAMALSTGFSAGSDVRHRFEEMFNFAKKKRGVPLLALVAAVVAAASSLIAVSSHVFVSQQNTEQNEPIFAESFEETQVSAEEEQPKAKPETHWVFEPDQSFKITAPFGQEFQGQIHTGVDIAAQAGSFILAAQAGQVAEIGENFDYGNYVRIKAEDGNEWFYAHCQSQLVEPGQTVGAGQAIAKVGNTGNATGSVLHLELITPSGSVDPLTVLTVPTSQQETLQLVWPVPDYKFVIRRMSMHHGGDDIAAPVGSDILAAKAGQVITAGQHWSYGNYIVIDHGNDLTTLYAHCSELLVQQGDTVAAGQPIATVGHTGQATGNHLHLELRNKQERLDAMDYFADIPEANGEE